MSRQVNRHETRTIAKAERALAVIAARKDAKRSLLERQTLREKAGFYNGRGVAAAITPSRSRLTKRRVKKANAFGRVLISYAEGGREISYHATKGWRTHRA